MTNSPAPKNTPAFLYQAAISFGVAVLFSGVAVANLPLDPWPRAAMGLAMLFLVTSTFTLAKVVRDQQESGRVVSRLDEVRLERLLAEYDPYRIPTVTPDPNWNAAPPASSPTGYHPVAN